MQSKSNSSSSYISDTQHVADGNCCLPGSSIGQHNFGGVSGGLGRGTGLIGQTQGRKIGGYGGRSAFVSYRPTRPNLSQTEGPGLGAKSSEISRGCGLQTTSSSGQLSLNNTMGDPSPTNGDGASVSSSAAPSLLPGADQSSTFVHMWSEASLQSSRISIHFQTCPTQTDNKPIRSKVTQTCCCCECLNG